MWIIYHATDSPTDGWANRKGRCQLLELRSNLPYAGLYPNGSETRPIPSGSFIPANTTPLPETVLGPLPSWANDPDLKKLKEKGKNIWQSIKKKVGKSDEGKKQ